MSAKPDFFRIGVFIVGAIAVLVVALLIFGGGQMFRPKIMAETYVESSVQGIELGSPVKFRGVLIGKVTDIAFAFTRYRLNQEKGYANYVVLIMQIDRELFPGMFKKDITPMLERGIQEGLRVRIQPQGVTGLNYLDIDYLDPTRFPILWPNWKPEYYYIPSAPGDVTSFLDSINDIMHEVQQLNIGGLSKAGTELIENLNTAITGAQLGKVSQDLQQLVGNVDKILADAKIPELSADTRKFLDEIEASNRELRQILKNIEPATRLDGNQIRAIVNNLDTTTKNLEQISADVKKRPSVLLWGSPSSAKEKPASRERRRE